MSGHDRMFVSCKHFLFYLEGCREPLKKVEQGIKQAVNSVLEVTVW